MLWRQAIICSSELDDMWLLLRNRERKMKKKKKKGKRRKKRHKELLKITNTVVRANTLELHRELTKRWWRQPGTRVKIQRGE